MCVCDVVYVYMFILVDQHTTKHAFVHATSGPTTCWSDKRCEYKLLCVFASLYLGASAALLLHTAGGYLLHTHTRALHANINLHRIAIASHRIVHLCASSAQVYAQVFDEVTSMNRCEKSLAGERARARFQWKLRWLHHSFCNSARLVADSDYIHEHRSRQSATSSHRVRATRFS